MNTNNKNILYCSFCGKSQHEVRKLIAGPTVFICDECVELCMDIIKEENKDTFVDYTSSIPFSGNPSPSFTRVDNFAVLKNLPTPNPKKLLLIALLSNPLECNECEEDSPYPVPGGEFLSDIERQVMMDLSGFLVQRRIDKIHNANPDS